MRYFSMTTNQGAMNFTTFLNDASGRVILSAAGLLVLAGGVGAILSPSLLAYPILAAISSLAAAVAGLGLTRAIYVAPSWALGTVFAGSYPLSLFYLLEVMAIKNRWPVEYISFPMAAVLLLLSATGIQSHRKNVPVAA